MTRHLMLHDKGSYRAGLSEADMSGLTALGYPNVFESSMPGFRDACKRNGLTFTIVSLELGNRIKSTRFLLCRVNWSLDEIDGRLGDHVTERLVKESFERLQTLLRDQEQDLLAEAEKQWEEAA